MHMVRPIGKSLMLHLALGIAVVGALSFSHPTQPTALSIGPRTIEQVELAAPEVPSAPIAMPAQSSAPQAPASATAPITSQDATPTLGLTPASRSALRATALTQYLSRVREKIGAHVLYPERLRLRRISGQAILELTVARDGQLQANRIAKSSGSNEIDELVRQAARDAAPFAPFGAELKERRLSFELPVELRLR